MMNWEVTPPILKTPSKVKKLLKDGYVDMTKWASWVWRFEVKPISECTEHATLKFGDSRETSYCSEAYVSFTDVSNQYLVLVMRRSNAVIRDGRLRFKHRYQVMALVPRFMGLLRTPEAYVLFLIIDGDIKTAYRIPKLTPAVVAGIINMGMQPPFFIKANRVAQNMLYLSIPVIDLGDLVANQVEQL